MLLNISLDLFDQVNDRKFSSINSSYFFKLDFIPATNPILPITPSDPSSSGLSSTRTPFFLSVSDGANEEMNRLHQQYTKLIQKNRK